MADILQSLSISSSGMTAQASRLRHVSENIANADTPGYRRKSLAFHEIANGGVESGRTNLSQAALPEIHDPAHPLAGENGTYQGANVDVIVEMADAREASRSYEANLKLFDQARQMSQGLLDLLRR